MNLSKSEAQVILRAKKYIERKNKAKKLANYFLLAVLLAFLIAMSLWELKSEILIFLPLFLIFFASVESPFVIKKPTFEDLVSLLDKKISESQGAMECIKDVKANT